MAQADAAPADHPLNRLHQVLAPVPRAAPTSSCTISPPDAVSSSAASAISPSTRKGTSSPTRLTPPCAKAMDYSSSTCQAVAPTCSTTTRATIIAFRGTSKVPRWRCSRGAKWRRCANATMCCWYSATCLPHWPTPRQRPPNWIPVLPPVFQRVSLSVTAPRWRGATTISVYSWVSFLSDRPLTRPAAAVLIRLLMLMCGVRRTNGFSPSR